MLQGFEVVDWYGDPFAELPGPEEGAGYWGHVDVDDELAESGAVG